MTAPDRKPSPPPRRRPGRPGVYAGIAAIVGILVLAFLAVSGRWPFERVTTARFTDTLEASNGQVFPGFRRAHAKGVCVSGWFEPTPEGADLSKARVFAQPRTPVLGRLSIGGGSPYGLDGEARVRSMALQLVDDGGGEWRMAMNSFPFFGAATLEDFRAQAIAGIPDPATGKPDPAKLAAYRASHPAAQRFADWAGAAPWSTSFANTRYNGVNAFRFTDAAGTVRHVRWSMVPEAPFEALSKAARAAADGDFLSTELAARLASAPLRWKMDVTIADVGDDVDDPSVSWPDARRTVTAGIVTLDASTPQADGPCRDLNFDPTILPSGVAVSDDPILAGRAAVYAASFDRRQRETAHGARDDAPKPAPAPGATR